MYIRLENNHSSTKTEVALIYLALNVSFAENCLNVMKF